MIPRWVEEGTVAGKVLGAIRGCRVDDPAYYSRAYRNQRSASSDGSVPLIEDLPIAKGGAKYRPDQIAALLDFVRSCDNDVLSDR